MDQDAFRKLLSAPRHGAPSQSGNSRGPRGSLLKTEKASESKPGDSKAEFKPRKIKKNSGSDYRDRASERRLGKAGDFAEVEAVLETFEKQHADEDREKVEEIRRYLGGDAAHTVLVKGLDFALLEQQKAKVYATDAAEDEEALEAVFNNTTIPDTASASAPSEALATSKPSGKKRTREELLRELKVKRAKGEVAQAPAVVEDRALEEAKKVGKFKPIGTGFKPIANTKVAKDVNGVEKKKKKKRKPEEGMAAKDSVNLPEASTGGAEGRAESAAGSQWQEPETRQKQTDPEPEPLPEDFDIFAGAGEYEGLNIDDDDEDDSDKDGSEGEVKPGKTTLNDVEMRDAERQDAEDAASRRRKKWIEDDEDEEPGEIPASPPNLDEKGKVKSRPSPSPLRDNSTPAERSPTPEPTRLAPLASSALPSIRDILAADEALELEDKRKARKEKKKAGGDDKGVSKEAKLNRDYQKLKSYQEKKGRG